MDVLDPTHPDDAQRQPGDYRGRLAPTPTGYLHLGHAYAFSIAAARSRAAGGALLMRIENIDRQRCRQAFTEAALADLRWLGLHWDEGPDVGGPFEPYVQSARMAWYREVWAMLRDRGLVYPCTRSRREIEAHAKLATSAAAGVAGSADTPGAVDADELDAEPLFPRQWRPPGGTGSGASEPGRCNWRLRVPDGAVIAFEDRRLGAVSHRAGCDFGDFLVWRRDDAPSYELAVVADDFAMRISEAVRGADLLRSTSRQLLLYRALDWKPPAFYHVPLLRDDSGRRLAKRFDSLAVRTLRDAGYTPEAVLARARALAEGR